MTTRVKRPTLDNNKKLVRTLKYLKETVDLVLTLSADNLNLMHWWVNKAYGVHEEYRSHTGGTMSMGKGSIYSTSTKQKINTKSSTEKELVAVADVLLVIFWMRNFMRAQGYTSNTLLA